MFFFHFSLLKPFFHFSSPAGLGSLLSILNIYYYERILKNILKTLSHSMQTWLSPLSGAVMRGACGLVFDLIKLWVKRQLVPLWLDGMKLEPNLTGVETSGTLAVSSFIQRRTPETAVFWAVKGAGKAFAVQREAGAGSVVLVDWERFEGTDPSKWFCELIGWERGLGEFFHEFSTVVFTHFDAAMAYPDSAKQLVLRLASDSAESKRFNVLVCVDSAMHAHSLLKLNQKYMRLLGPPYCGRCTEMELIAGGFKEVRFGAYSGTIGLSAVANEISDTMLELRAAQANTAWNEGESLLHWYRKGSDSNV